MKTLFLSMIVCTYALIIGSGTMLGQVECPPASSDCGAWNSDRYVFRLYGDCHVQVDVESRVCNGVFEYRISNITLLGDVENCSYMDEFTLREYNISTLQEWIDLKLLYEKYPVWGGSGRTIPVCSEGEMVHAKFFSASCGIWVKCKWEITSDAPNCWPGISTPAPPEDGEVAVWKWQPCGETCCKRTYELCLIDGAVSVKRVGAVRISDCSEQNTFGTENQCQSGCY